MKSMVHELKFFSKALIPLFLSVSTPAIAEGEHSTDFENSAQEESKRYSLFTEEEQKILTSGRISGARIAGGALLGAVVGFGVGHAVIGNYQASKAWIYTIVDSVLLTATVGGILYDLSSDS